MFVQKIYFIFWMLLDIECHIYNQFWPALNRKTVQSSGVIVSVAPTTWLCWLKQFCFNIFDWKASHDRELLYKIKELWVCGKLKNIMPADLCRSRLGHLLLAVWGHRWELQHWVDWRVSRVWMGTGGGHRSLRRPPHWCPGRRKVW